MIGRVAAALGLALLSGATLVFVIACAASIGEMRIPLSAVGETASNALFGTHFALDPIESGIVWNYRLSRALLAACCGAALALSGAVLQALLRNPLAEPYLLGISAGASTGAVAVMILGIGGGVLSLTGGAFAGAVLAFAVVALLAAGAGGGSSRIILAGIAGSQLFTAITAAIVTTSANAEQARGAMFWLLGDLGGVRWRDVAVAAPVALGGLAIIAAHARALDAFTFGTDAAASLGVSVTRIRLVLFALTAAMTAVMVSMVGAVGFVGLVVPHAARFLTGPPHGRLLPAAATIGAVFMVLADIASRTVVPRHVLPIGVVTALMGAPAFAILLYRARRLA